MQLLHHSHTSCLGDGAQCCSFIIPSCNLRSVYVVLTVPECCVHVQEVDKKAAAARKRQRKEKEKEAKPKRAKVCSASGAVLDNLLHTF